MRNKLVIAAIALVVGLAAGTAGAVNPFVDIGSTGSHQDNIVAIYEAGVTLGCNQAGDNYCPANLVTRSQMASFLARGLGLSSGTTKNFPKANSRGETQAYCSLVAANPGTYNPGPCLPVTTLIEVTGAFIHTAMTIGSDGLPVVAYTGDAGFDDEGDLKAAKCTNVACSAFTLAVVDAAGDTGSYPSIAIGSDGMPVVSYWDAVGDLKVAKCVTIGCGGTSIKSTADAVGNAGPHTSIAITPDGRPVISYHEEDSADLRVAKCDNSSCTSAAVTTLDSSGDVGDYTSIAVGADGIPVIGYRDGSNTAVKVAKCLNQSCSGIPTVTTVDNAASVGVGLSMALGTDGFPILSYFDLTSEDLKVAKCINAACTGTSTVTTVDTGGMVGFDTSIAIGTDGLPVISYYDQTNHSVKIAKCVNAACTGNATITTFEFVDGGTSNSIAIGVDGVPLVAYFETSDDALWITRLSP